MKTISFLFMVGCIALFEANCQNNSFIYFVSSTESRGRDIYKIYPDGTSKQKLTKKLGNGHYPHHNNPKISPDEQQIAFQSDPDGHDRYTIWTMNVDGGNTKKVTDAEGLYPCWSSDGRSIIFSGRRKGVWEVISIPSTGGSEKILTNNYSNNKRPGWGATVTYHPDGNSIIYSYIREKILFEMDLKTGETRQITSAEESYTHPIFSSDETSIAVNKKEGDHYNLVLISPNGEFQKTLAENIVSYSAPAWSPDGNEIIFTGMVSGNQELFKLNLTTNKEIRLTDNNAFDAMPTWR